VHEASRLALAFYHLPALNWEADNTRMSQFWAKTMAILPPWKGKLWKTSSGPGPNTQPQPSRERYCHGA